MHTGNRWALALLGGTLMSSAFATPATAAEYAAAVPDQIAAFRFVPGAQCGKNRFGVRECDVAGYEAAGDPDSCSPDAPLFGGVWADGGVDLLYRFPDAGRVAHLHDRQLVCIAMQVGTEPGLPSWSYVVAVPARGVPDCRGEHLCRHADFPVDWLGELPFEPCRLLSNGGYSGGCAAGRVRRDQLDDYSMSIKPIGD